VSVGNINQQNPIVEGWWKNSPGLPTGGEPRNVARKKRVSRGVLATKKP